MSRSPLSKSRFIVGLALVVIAALLFLFARGNVSTAGAVALGVIGLVSIAISRKSPSQGG